MCGQGSRKEVFGNGECKAVLRVHFETNPRALRPWGLSMSTEAVTPTFFSPPLSCRCFYYEELYRAMTHSVFLSLFHSYLSRDKCLSASVLQLVCLLEDPKLSLICADASEGKWVSSLTGLERILEVLSLCSKPQLHFFFRFRTPELRGIKDLYLHAGTLHQLGH